MVGMGRTTRTTAYGLRKPMCKPAFPNQPMNIIVVQCANLGLMYVHRIPGIEVNWSNAQRVLLGTGIDVLVILDCCFAASAGRCATTQKAEVLAACGLNNRTPLPGKYSFTAKLLPVLRKALRQSENKAVTTSTLHSLLTKKEAGLQQTPILISLITGNACTSHCILIHEIAKKDANAPPEPVRSQFYFKISSNRRLTEAINDWTNIVHHLPAGTLSIALETREMLASDNGPSAAAIDSAREIMNSSADSIEDFTESLTAAARISFPCFVLAVRCVLCLRRRASQPERSRTRSDLKFEWPFKSSWKDGGSISSSGLDLRRDVKIPKLSSLPLTTGGFRNAVYNLYQHSRSPRRYCHGILDDRDVIVEFQALRSHETSEDYRDRVVSSAESLMFTATPTPDPELRILKCLGYMSYEGKLALVFALPKGSSKVYVTLKTLRDNYGTIGGVALDYRMNIARGIASTLAKLDMMGCRHRKITADDVLFFGTIGDTDDYPTYQLNSPWIFGMEPHDMQAEDTSTSAQDSQLQTIGDNRLLTRTYLAIQRQVGFNYNLHDQQQDAKSNDIMNLVS